MPRLRPIRPSLWQLPPIFGAVLVLVFPVANAQRESLGDRLDRELRSGISTPDLKEQMRPPLVGKQYWVETMKRTDFPVRFLGISDDGKPATQQYVLRERISFTVAGFTVHDHKNYVKVVFADGRVGFLPENPEFGHTSQLFENQFDLGDKTERDDWHEYIFSSDPEVVYAKERTAFNEEREAAARTARIAQAAEAAHRARGGVKIGMTRKQVLASNWGVPQDVHRTTTARAVTEQWVYEDGNYLYFENGILKVIQN